MGRKLRTTLPVQPKLLNPKWPGLGKVASREKIIKQKQKLHYDKRHRARAFKPLSKRQRVSVKDQRKTGIVQHESKFPRSYHVQTDQGIIRRNRRFLSALPEENKSKSDSQGQGCSETAPKSPMKLSDNPKENTDTCGNPEDTGGQNYIVTKSERCVKPPDRLIY